MNTTYNGFENWETWNVNLWLNNDEVMYKHLQVLKNSSDLKTYVLHKFATDNKFGDLDKQSEVDRVNFQEIMEANAND